MRAVELATDQSIQAHMYEVTFIGGKQEFIICLLHIFAVKFCKFYDSIGRVISNVLHWTRFRGFN